MNAYDRGTRLEGRPAVKRQRGRPGTVSATSLAEMGEKKKVASSKVRKPCLRNSSSCVLDNFVRFKLCFANEFTLTPQFFDLDYDTFD